VTVSDDLVKLVPPPAEPPQAPDWSQVESDLALRLPDDYKWLVERYGPGSFDDFLHVFQPGAESEWVRLETQAVRGAELLQQHVDKGESIPYEVNELLDVAGTDNGDTIYWVKRPAAGPNAWTIVANGARNTKWPSFPGGLVEFLVAVFSGAVHPDVFPKSFPRAHPTFEAY
jgi:hypothetical protein